ncbi:SET family sugar efflux transporter-like MFS transporter [Peribacillus deserti]|uniref:SET family sugar efflux transporter-like MFS transporter n=1 Tax=Peribacillus deserti TaxID=673318 RepID=A0ABS2QIC7_9BACI|nr:sugar efflux transporter [Peribacillus deserti]MBM7692051.1 SET family sugar efflux transporter-like MFS transporter [Peribacillus deserti]
MKNKNVLAALKERLLFIWRIPSLPVLFLLNILYGLGMSFFAPFSSLFGIDEVGMSNIGFGLFMTIMAVGGVVISSYIAKKSDTTLSRRKILIYSSLAGALGYILFAYLRNYYALALTGFFVLGSAAATVPQLWAYARDALTNAKVPSEETPLIMNIFRMFFALAWVGGPALGAWLVMVFDFKGLFFFVAACYLLGMLTAIFLLKDIERQEVPNQETIKVKKYISKPHILANLAAAFLLYAASSIHMLNVPLFVTKVLHGTEMQVGIIFSVAPIFEVPMMIIIGMMATKMDNSILIKIGYFMAFIYFLIFGFVSEPWQIYPLQILSAAQISITAGIAIAYFQDFIPEAPGTATTLYMNTTQIGSTAGYLLFGLISSMISYGQMITIYTIFAAIGCLFITVYGKERIAGSKSKGMSV